MRSIDCLIRLFETVLRSFRYNIPEFMFFPHTIIYFRSLFVKHCRSMKFLFLPFTGMKIENYQYIRARACARVRVCAYVCAHTYVYV